MVTVPVQLGDHVLNFAALVVVIVGVFLLLCLLVVHLHLCQVGLYYQQVVIGRDCAVVFVYLLGRVLALLL